MKKGRVSKPRPDLSSLPIRSALPILSAWIEPRVTPKHMHPHEKIRDADLLALAVLRYLHKVPYFNLWWNMLCQDVGLPLPSLTQAHVRLLVLEGLLSEVELLDCCIPPCSAVTALLAESARTT